MLNEMYSRDRAFIRPLSVQFCAQTSGSCFLHLTDFCYSWKKEYRSQAGHQYTHSFFLFSSWLQYRDYEQKATFLLKLIQTASRGKELILMMS